MAGAAPSLDQLMEDLRRIARDAPQPAPDTSEPAAPPLNSLSLADHGIRIQGFPDASDRLAAPAPTTAREKKGGNHMLLLGGALGIVVLIIGAVLVFRKKGDAGLVPLDPKAARSPQGSVRPRAADEEGKREASGQPSRAAAKEGDGEVEGEGEGEESDHERRVRFAREVQVREFEREQPPRVSVKISSDDVL